MSAPTQPLRDPAAGAPAAAPASKGTLKIGITCRNCDDWTTVVVEQDGQPVAELPCPDHTPREAS